MTKRLTVSDLLILIAVVALLVGAVLALAGGDPSGVAKNNVWAI